MLESGEHSGTGDTSGRTGRLGVKGGLAPPSPPQPPQKIRGALAPVPQGGNRGLKVIGRAEFTLGQGGA